MSFSGSIINTPSGIAVGGFAVNQEEVIIGSAVLSEGSCCGCGTSIPLIEWKDCDTTGKIIGFILGRSLNFIFNYGSKIFNTINQVLYLGKVTEYFFNFLDQAATKGLDFAQFIGKHLKPLILNRATIATFNWSYDYILAPIGRAIRCIARFIFKTVLWDHMIRPCANWLFTNPTPKNDAPKGNSLLSEVFTTLWNWTAVPIAHCLDDIFIGGVSGTIHKTPKPENRTEQ